MKNFLIHVIRFYQKYVSPLKLPSCRFYPTCSEYSLQAINKYGAIKGLYKAGRRILRCHPLHPGGHDPVE